MAAVITIPSYPSFFETWQQPTGEPIELTSPDPVKSAMQNESETLPAEWFHTGDPGTLLKLYVRHAVYADVLARQIRAMWPTSTDDTKGWARLRTMMRAHGAQTDKLCQLATKLKLTPSSRYRSDHTERTTRGMGYVPPWEDWGDRRKRS